MNGSLLETAASSAAAIAPGIQLADDYAVGLLFLGLAVLVAIVTLTHQRARAFSPATVYLSLGAVAAVGTAALGAPWLDLIDDAEIVQRVSELVVIVALFATGLRLDRSLLPREWRTPALLLGIVMPLTIAAVAAYGVWAMGLSAGAAVVLGAALAPTDPVLAGDLGVGPPGEGHESEPRFALTSEAGLNDGLAFPFLLLGLVIASGVGAGDVGRWIALDVVYALAVGVGAGALGGWAIAEVATRLRERNLVAAELDGWAAIGAVLAIYGVTEVLGGYGFLAAFVGGIAFRRRERDHEYNKGVHAGAETLERVLELAMIVLLGSLLTVNGLQAPGVAGWLLAPVLLLAIRPLLSLASLVRTPLDMKERAYVGWFGVRGVGSVYYASAVVASGLLPAEESILIMWTVAAVVAVSIVVHGITGTPLTRRLTRGEGKPEPAAPQDDLPVAPDDLTRRPSGAPTYSWSSSGPNE